MSQSIHMLPGYYQRLVSFRQRLQRLYRSSRSVSTSELILCIREATTVSQLTKAVNAMQQQLWNIPAAERSVSQDQLVGTLCTQVLQASSPSMRIAAADWLRLLTQAGTVSHPQEIFVTLVTASINVKDVIETGKKELHAYLKMIFDCFWSFRYPYPAFTWQQFPANEVFFPLAALVASAPSDMQELLIAIFSELPTLDEPEFVEYLLPVALTWSKHAKMDYRRRATDILARIQSGDAQVALYRLQLDDDPDVRDSAKHAACFIQNAE